MAEIAPLAVALAIALGAVEAAKLAISKIGANGKGNPDNRSGSIRCWFQTSDHEHRLRRVTEIVTATDDDGVPMVYAPRALARKQAEILNELKRMNVTLGAISQGINGQSRRSG